MKSKTLDRLSPSLRILLLYLLLWMFPIALFWVFKGGLNPMLYSIVFLYGWYPILGCVISYQIGERDYFGKLKWLVPICIGVVNGLVWCLTFGLANTFSSGNLNPPQVEDILFQTMPAIIGFALGVVLRPKEEKKNISDGSSRWLLNYLILWIIPIVVFLIASNWMDTVVIYLIALFIWYPVLSGGVSFIFGRNNKWDKLKWCSPVLFGVMGGVALRLMCVLDSNLEKSLIMENVNEFLWNIVAATIGLVIGVVICYVNNRRKVK